MSESEQNSLPVVKPRPVRKRSKKTARNPRRLPPYNVILLNDDDHTYEYVIEMLKKLFGYDQSKGYVIASQVDNSGRAILLTTTKEHAELKREQIHAYGPDTRIARCAGSMSARIEPVA